MRQEVPYKLMSKKAMEYFNEMKAHSVRVATLEKHHGQVHSLILGQCTQLLQDKNEARESLGTSECVLKATGSLQAHRECGVEAD
jgi:hypothetical protein